MPQRLLPEHMVPQVFVPLEELPSGPGGKVDRQALMELPWSPAEKDESSIVAPRDEKEEILAAILVRGLGTG